MWRPSLSQTYLIRVQTTGVDFFLHEEPVYPCMRQTVRKAQPRPVHLNWRFTTLERCSELPMRMSLEVMRTSLLINHTQ